MEFYLAAGKLKLVAGASRMSPVDKRFWAGFEAPLEEEQPHPWGLAREWGRIWTLRHWTELGPCSCSPPHPRPSKKCKDYKLARRVQRALDEHPDSRGYYSIFSAMRERGGRAPGAKDKKARTKKNLPPLSPPDDQVFRFYESCERGRARKTLKKFRDLTEKRLKSIIRRGNRRRRPA